MSADSTDSTTEEQKNLDESAETGAGAASGESAAAATSASKRGPKIKSALGSQSGPRLRDNQVPYGKTPKSTIKVGDVLYLDGAELSRPIDAPASVKRVTVLAIVVAILISALALGSYFDYIMNEPLRQQQSLQDNLSREVSLDLPKLKKYVELSDEKIMKKLENKGFTLYERTPVGTNPDGGFEVIKLPEGVTLDDAMAMYAKGVDRLSASNAVRLLKGAWTLTVSRKGGLDMRVRYADFESGSIEKAMQNAMKAAGLSNSKVKDSGVDDSGNTYQAGTFSINDGEDTYSWRVSVIDLSEVYSISGLPNTAYYVGIRVYQ